MLPRYKTNIRVCNGTRYSILMQYAGGLLVGTVLNETNR